MTEHRIWDRHEWQRWIISLLRVRYGHDGMQEVPDGYGGDFGIEAFSRDGCAYQCYVADEPTTKKHLHQAQRKKITQDLKKFVVNAPDLAKLLSPTKIRRWILVVPRYESAQLARLCGIKGSEVRQHNLSYVDDDFAVHVCTDDAWPIEKSMLAKHGVTRLQVETAPPEPNVVSAWKDSDPARLQKLHHKSLQLVATTRVDKFINVTVQNYIRGQNVHEQLRDISADICDDLLRIKVAFEERLEIECAIATQKARITYAEVEKEFKSRLVDSGLKLSPELVDRLSAEAMADWLIRCPLNFDEAEETP